MTFVFLPTMTIAPCSIFFIKFLRSRSRQSVWTPSQELISSQLRYLPTSCCQLFNEGKDIPLDSKLCDGVNGKIFCTISLTILAMLPHKFGQSVASIPLVLQILSQINNCAIHLVWVDMVSRTTLRRFSSPTKYLGGLTRWSTLQFGTYLKSP